MPQYILRIFGIHLSSQSHYLLSVYRVIKDDEIVTILSLGQIFVIIHILIDCNDRQISMMTYDDSPPLITSLILKSLAAVDIRSSKITRFLVLG